MFLPDSKFGQKSMLLHRYLTGATEGLHVDHQDHNGLNNCRHNIPVTTPSENMLNRRPHRNSKSGIRGVVKNQNGRWVATIKVQKKRIPLGTFSTTDEAKEAFDKALKTREYPTLRRSRGKGTIIPTGSKNWAYSFRKKGIKKHVGGFGSREEAELALRQGLSI